MIFEGVGAVLLRRVVVIVFIVRLGRLQGRTPRAVVVVTVDALLPERPWICHPGQDPRLGRERRVGSAEGSGGRVKQLHVQVRAVVQDLHGLAGPICPISLSGVDCALAPDAELVGWHVVGGAAVDGEHAVEDPIHESEVGLHGPHRTLQVPNIHHEHAPRRQQLVCRLEKSNCPKLLEGGVSEVDDDAVEDPAFGLGLRASPHHPSIGVGVLDPEVRVCEGSGHLREMPPGGVRHRRVNVDEGDRLHGVEL
mmetsp:Transcript_66684/g.192653  ORF Transcript_66684/g.192653 Transcript_66684/m.192653 type:complete len:252 (+) Transcript_66684:1265-2020(+)